MNDAFPLLCITNCLSFIAGVIVVMALAACVRSGQISERER